MGKILNIAIVLSLVLVPLWANATGSRDIFTVKNIQVDITERDGETARRHAFTEAQAVAFHKILERIVAKKDLEYLPEFSPEEISYLFKEVSVVNEKVSNTRYMATLNVSFDREKVNQMLTEMGITFVLSSSKPYLLIPIYINNGHASIFDSNPWMNVWKSPPDSALVPLVTIKYDQLDRQLIKPANMTRDALIELEGVYDTEGIIIAQVTKGSNNIFLSVSKYDNGLLIEKYDRSFPTGNTGFNTALSNAANYMIKRDEEKWRKHMAINVADPNQLVVVAPIRDLEQLISIQNRLAKVPIIAKYEIKATKMDRAQINLSHSSTPEDIAKSLARQKLKLVRVSDDTWGLQDMIPAPRQELILQDIPNEAPVIGEEEETVE